MAVAFTGVVVSCETRFRTKVERAIPTHFDANWVVTIDVESADVDAPCSAGERASFLVHSPTHVFFDSAERVAGRRWRFTLESNGPRRWVNLSAREVDLTSR